MIKMKITALYDENCTLCQETKRRLEVIDKFGKVKWISLQQFERNSDNNPFTAKDLRQELHIILPDNRVLKGYDAVRKLLLISPLTFPIGIVLYAPLIPYIGRPIYKWIASNRHIFLRSKCEDGSCSL